MGDRVQVAEAARTLAHHWCSSDGMDRIGVERILLSYPQPHQALIAALVMDTLWTRYHDSTARDTWRELLFDLAGVEEEL